MRESDLYPPVKSFLENQGYAVKGEIGACDVVAVRGDEPPVIVELKGRVTLELVLQGVARQSVTDDVYLGVPPITGRAAHRRQQAITGLCRRLGLGLLTISAGHVEVLVDPGPYQPRKSAARRRRLLGEFQRRVGDPAAGGASRRRPGMTAYRQDALRCALHLKRHGPTKASVVAGATGVARARTILYDDVYGWFERVGTGIYALSPNGATGLDTFADAAANLEDASR